MKKDLYLLAMLVLLSWQNPLVAQTFSPVTDAGNQIGTVSMLGNFRGCAWVDYDADGDLDLSVGGAGAIFRNDGGNNFSVVRLNGLFIGNRCSMSWGDVDRDGKVDCLYNFFDGTSRVSDSGIYFNDGSGNFESVSPNPDATSVGWSASLGEWNNDGFLDPIYAVAINFGFTTPALFFNNEGGRSFSRVTGPGFTQETEDYTVAHWTDYDDDGDLDLFLASGPGGSSKADPLYRNLLKEKGEPSFERITDLSFVSQAQDGQCYNFIDTDLDGDRDMYLTNWSGANNRYYALENDVYVAKSNALIPANGQEAHLSNGWGDLDNDGYEDVIVTGTMNSPSIGVYRNKGNHEFERITNPFPVANNAVVSGLTIGDYDGDGDLDFFTLGNSSPTRGYQALFNNELDNDNHWIQFDLRGAAPSNTTAIGARVRVKATIDGVDRWLQREVSAQNTFMGHNALRVHFGLGANTTVDSVRIHWPSGNEEIRTNLDVDMLHTLTEEGGMVGVDPLTFPAPTNVLTIFPNPGDTFISVALPARLSQGGGTLSVYDSAGKEVRNIQLESERAYLLERKALTPGRYVLVWQVGEKRYRGQLVLR